MPTSRPTRRQLVQGAAGLAAAAAAAGGVANSVLAAQATPLAPPVASPVAGFITSTRPYLIATDPATLEITPLITAGDQVGDYQMAGVPDGLGAYGSDEGVVVFVNHELTTVEDEDISESRVSRLVLDPQTGAVLSGTYALDGTEGYDRLCSAFLAGPEVGFEQPVFFTGEESQDGQFGGLSIAIDGATSEVTQLPWLGHLAHENQIVVPGFAGKTVVVTTDDNSDGSELYMFLADSPEGVLTGAGTLHVFKADSGANTADIAKGTELTGRFVPLTEADNADAATLQAAADAAGAFTFVRLEDVTYDRTTTTTIYFADTGDDAEPNLDGSGKPFTLNGRLYSMAFDPADPTKVTSLKVLLDGDAGDDLKNPDNLDASASTIVICEDRNGYNRAENSDDTGRVLAYDIASGTLTAIAKIDQSDGEGVLDAGDKAGSWESSGVINTEALYGPGTWLIDVQAHGITVPQFGGEDQGGQLLLLRQV